MGRRPTGRKYPKHISIQVKEDHNEDLKLFCSYLNEVAPLEDSTWTIRDVVLTLLYGSWNQNPKWFLSNHFEKFSRVDLQNLRKKLETQPVEKSKKVPIKESPIMEEKLEPDSSEIESKDEQLELVFDDSYSNFMEQLNSITGE